MLTQRNALNASFAGLPYDVIDQRRVNSGVVADCALFLEIGPIKSVSSHRATKAVRLHESVTTLTRGDD